MERKDAAKRNEVEGKFGEGKRKYRLDRIRGKLSETSDSIVILQFIIMNLWRTLRDILSFFFGERPKSRFGHVVRDSYPQIVHFGFLEARLVTCS